MAPLYLILGCLAYGYPREASWRAVVYFTLLLLRAMFRLRRCW